MRNRDRETGIEKGEMEKSGWDRETSWINFGFSNGRAEIKITDNATCPGQRDHMEPVCEMHKMRTTGTSLSNDPSSCTDR